MSGTQKKREQFKKGDDVWFLMPAPQGVPPKRVRVRIVQVMRAALKIRFFEGELSHGRETTVTFDKVQPIELPATPPTSLTERRRSAPIIPPPPTMAEVLSMPSPPAMPAPADTDDRVMADVKSWAAMGGELLAPLHQRVELLRTTRVALAAERDAIEAEENEVEADLKEAREQLAKVEKLVALVREGSA